MNSSTRQTLASAIQTLVGRKLSSVTFVADYIQLAFDGPEMNAYTTPTVTRGSESLTFGQPGYRDSICSQIDRLVERTGVDDQQLLLVFENRTVFSISLRHDDYRGPEALMFSLDTKEGCWVV